MSNKIINTWIKINFFYCYCVTLVTIVMMKQVAFFKDFSIFFITCGQCYKTRFEEIDSVEFGEVKCSDLLGQFGPSNLPQSVRSPEKNKDILSR